MGPITSTISEPVGDPIYSQPDTPEIRWLIDNDHAYRVIAAAINRARYSISISQLALDPDFTGYSEPASAEPPVPFIEMLLSAARDRDVDVRVLLNSTLLLNTLKPLRRFLASQRPGSNKVQMRGLSFFPQMLHAKIVIVDSRIAFLVGSPFVNGYWDSQAHAPVDPRRPRRELGGRPLHDVSVQISGPAANSVNEFFEMLWAAGKGDGENFFPRLPSSDHWLQPCATPTQIATTVPADINGFGRGSTFILERLEHALRRATSLIYIEQQYLSSRRIFKALQRALVRSPKLEVIVVANQNADITAYSSWQNAALREFGLLDHPRVGVFALWSASDTHAPREINQVFVHSKVVIIDDKWAMCGSANLDGVSLHSYGADFRGVLGRRIFRNVRNFDIAVCVGGFEQTGDLDPARSLRRELWSEHLGLHFNPATSRPAGGWLDIWRAAALNNIAMLTSGSSPGEGAFILPYSTTGKPSSQLRDCGIDSTQHSLYLQFNPGWFERSFALGWVLNMFS